VGNSRWARCGDAYTKSFAAENAEGGMINDWYARAELLAEQGLYDPLSEHDACGVGMVVSLDGKPRRDVVEKGIEALKNVYHRGAVDADGKTGDGAGILLEIPREFFRAYLERIGKQRTRGRIAVGMLFLPKKNLNTQDQCRQIVEYEIIRFGYGIHGWRQVPVVSDVIGEIAGDSRPQIEQVIFATPENVNEQALERDLYIIRKRIEKALQAAAIKECYVCSLSCRSIVYKGLFKAEQLTAFYPDLLDPRFISAYAIFHQRFSTNTAPAWHLAQPFRMIAHNGEINTLKGNVNFMKSHEATFHAAAFEGMEADVIPVIPDNTSDTGALDSVIEVLTRAGRELPLAKLIVMPPAWSLMNDLPDAHRDMYHCLNSISEPWDGPAALCATDGEWVIAGMDRNGLRPLRYSITKDGLLLACSESGMVHVADTDIIKRGRLGPGDIIGVHLPSGKLYEEPMLKDFLAAKQPYHEWKNNIISLKSLVDAAPAHSQVELPNGEQVTKLAIAAGMTYEDVEHILHPMAETGKEAVGSMGDDSPLAILSDRHRPFHHFFRQNFSQVTNPPIDPIRERSVMSLYTRFGNDGNYLAHDPSHGEILLAESPILLANEMAAISKHFAKKITKLDCVFAVNGDCSALSNALEALISQAEKAVRAGQSYLILTDEKVDDSHAAIPMILAISAVHSHLVRAKLRKKASLLVCTSQCGDVHSAAVMIGAGATTIHAYLAEALILDRMKRGLLRQNALANFKEAMDNGLLKIMSKMGISVISAYRGGMNFEAIGLSRSLVAKYFSGLSSRISGIGVDGIQSRILRQHQKAFAVNALETLPVGGFYRVRAQGEVHAWQAEATHMLQSAVAKGSYQLYKKYSALVHSTPPIHLRDLLDFRSDLETISVDLVEPVASIRKRFVAPAMSLGALSKEAHETLAIAMNRMGAGSNSGEGGEGSERFKPYENGDNANSTIKQIASARFGVTAEYLLSAKEIQIKVAQGAKPGEGGQLPGFKVTTEIARLRHATPGVMLISPPPHHDIYSIEDLAQLIYDLKQINPTAIVSVKLVAQSGIGTIASGVAKAMADKIVIAGHNGGTGASPWSSVKHAGIPWEMGLAEANQVLTLNRLRHRVKLQTDGGLKTGRDIVIAAMLGAEEYALGTASLVAMGCILVRQCHSNTCPVGITTQDERLREKFTGTVDKVINLFSFVAEEVREILASLGFKTIDEIVGRSDLLVQVNRGAEDLVDLDLNALLALADAGSKPRVFSLPPLKSPPQAGGIEGGRRNEVPDTLDAELLQDAKSALLSGEKIQLATTVKNTMRAVGTRISSELVKWRDQHVDHALLSEDHITLKLRGSAGQSLGAFLTQGIKIELYGDANDYVGKGLSGGLIVIRPRPSSTLIPHEHTIIGNTVLYGATSGKLFASGQAGERFAVRNSGAEVVVEGAGSNACEYMTAGVAVILGNVGHNFGAGMTGGMAFIYDASDTMSSRINAETVVWNRVLHPHWENVLKNLITQHQLHTNSPRAEMILAGWEYELPKFQQICPKEMLSRLEYPLTVSEESKARA
jgi:glutamate synthase (NADPH/NADH) large chain